jgi:iron complex outermembrane receptor protein
MPDPGPMIIPVQRQAPTGHPPRRPGGCFCLVALAAGLGLSALVSSAAGQTDAALPPPSDLKKLSVEELMDIDVSSVSMHPEKLFDSASAVQVITADDIGQSDATSLPEALRLASNLEVAQVDSRQWAISARGFDNLFADKMLVLIDGRSVYTPLFAGVYWDVQNTMLEDLDRIEVISGPGATQWGSNAVNGVINVTTKTAQDTQGGLLITGLGSELQALAEVRYGGQIAPGLYYRVYAMDFDRGDSTLPDGTSAYDAWRMAQGGFRMDWNAADDNVVTLQGDLYNGSVTRNGPDDIQMNGGNLLGRWTRTVAEDSQLKVQVYYDETYRSIPNSFIQTLNTYDFDLQDRLPLGSTHDFTWGLGYRLEDDSIVNTPSEAFLPPKASQQTLSAFAQDEIVLIQDRLHLTLGSKFEHYNYTGPEFEPSGRVAWTPSKDQTVWAAVSRAVRVPSRIDLDLYEPATPPYRVAGGPEVVSEKLIAYELGYRKQLNPNVSLSLATYYNDYNDLRSLEPLDPPAAFPVEIASGLRGKSTGAELSADWRILPAWRLHAGWTEMRVGSEPEPGTIDRSSNRSIALDPNHQGQLRSLVDLGQGWQFDSTLRYVAPIANQEVPGYTEMDLRLAWRPTAMWEFSIDGQNLLHAHHVEFNPPGTSREIGRSVFGKAAWHF